MVSIKTQNNFIHVILDKSLILWKEGFRGQEQKLEKNLFYDNDGNIDYPFIDKYWHLYQFKLFYTLSPDIDIKYQEAIDFIKSL